MALFQKKYAWQLSDFHTLFTLKTLQNLDFDTLETMQHREHACFLTILLQFIFNPALRPPTRGVFVFDSAMAVANWTRKVNRPGSEILCTSCCKVRHLLSSSPFCCPFFSSSWSTKFQQLRSGQVYTSKLISLH